MNHSDAPSLASMSHHEPAAAGGGTPAQARAGAVHLIFWALWFIIDGRVNRIDLLPDGLGYLLVMAALAPLPGGGLHRAALVRLAPLLALGSILQHDISWVDARDPGNLALHAALLAGSAAWFWLLGGACLSLLTGPDSRAGERPAALSVLRVARVAVVALLAVSLIDDCLGQPSRNSAAAYGLLAWRVAAFGSWMWALWRLWPRRG